MNPSATSRRTGPRLGPGPRMSTPGSAELVDIVRSAASEPGDRRFTRLELCSVGPPGTGLRTFLTVDISNVHPLDVMTVGDKIFIWGFHVC